MEDVLQVVVSTGSTTRWSLRVVEERTPLVEVRGALATSLETTVTDRGDPTTPVAVVPRLALGASTSTEDGVAHGGGER